LGLAAAFIRVGWMPDQAHAWRREISQDRPLSEISEEGGANFVLHPQHGAEPQVSRLKTFVELARPEGVDAAQEFPSQGKSCPLTSADTERFLGIAMTDDLSRSVGIRSSKNSINRFVSFMSRRFAYGMVRDSAATTYKMHFTELCSCRTAASKDNRAARIRVKSSSPPGCPSGLNMSSEM
jgi:hypothetical protein